MINPLIKAMTSRWIYHYFDKLLNSFYSRKKGTRKYLCSLVKWLNVNLILLNSYHYNTSPYCQYQIKHHETLTIQGFPMFSRILVLMNHYKPFLFNKKCCTNFIFCPQFGFNIHHVHVMHVCHSQETHSIYTMLSEGCNLVVLYTTLPKRCLNIISQRYFITF